MHSLRSAPKRPARPPFPYPIVVPTYACLSRSAREQDTRLEASLHLWAGLFATASIEQQQQLLLLQSTVAGCLVRARPSVPFLLCPLGIERAFVSRENSTTLTTSSLVRGVFPLPSPRQHGIQRTAAVHLSAR